jgi:hypothetical protein
MLSQRPRARATNEGDDVEADKQALLGGSEERQQG